MEFLDDATPLSDRNPLWALWGHRVLSKRAWVGSDCGKTFNIKATRWL
jgi:hypothetical protein